MYQIFINKIKTSTGLLVLVLSSMLGNAQKIDSLKSLLPKSSGTTKYEVLYALAYEYSDVNDSLSLLFAEDLFTLAKSLGDSNLIVKAGRIKSGELRRLERLDEAIEGALVALQIARRHENLIEIKLLLNSLAISYTYLGLYDKALTYNFESLIIREDEGNKSDISIALNNIGLIYYKLKNYQKSIEYYNRSLLLKREVKDYYDLDRLLINIGHCYNSLGSYKKARDYLNEALSICEEECSNQIKLESQIGLGVSYFQMGDYPEALIHFEESFEVAKMIGNSRYQAENLIYLAQIKILNKEYESAKALLVKAEKLSSAKGYNVLVTDTYKYFSKLYNQTNDYKNAAYYQSKYITLNDSIYNADLIKNLATVQSEFEERENMKTIAEKDEFLRLKEEIISRQRQQYIFVFAIALLILGLATALMWAGMLQRKANRLLADSKANLAKKVDERTAELLHANNELDHFIYKTSHDIRGPLATFKGLCMVALTDIKDPTGLDLVKKLDVTADKLNTILTRLLIVNQINTAELKPGIVDLHACIEEILALEKKKELPPRMVINYEIEKDVNLNSDNNLVRIILENLIANSIKFCDRSIRVDPFINIKISKENNAVVFNVTDNGIGIADDSRDNIFQMFVRASERSEPGGIGLYLSRLSTEKLGGTIELIHTSEKLTCFCVKIPCDLEPLLISRQKEKV